MLETYFTRGDARSFLVSRAQGEGRGGGGSRDLAVGRLRAKSGGRTSRGRKLERPGLSGDVAALQEGETPANGADGGAAREPDGRRGACGVVLGA